MITEYFALAYVSEVVAVALAAKGARLRGVAEAGGGAPGVADGTYYGHGKIGFVFVRYGLYVVDCRWSDLGGSGGGEEVT